ncbi:MAG TPA: coproporphyrinogen III oxidase, partial [Trichocoleus sp.]
MTSSFVSPATASNSAVPPSDSRERVSQAFKQLQDDICRQLEALDGAGTFQQDAWERPEGGGGR